MVKTNILTKTKSSQFPATPKWHLFQFWVPSQKLLVLMVVCCKAPFASVRHHHLRGEGLDFPSRDALSYLGFLYGTTGMTPLTYSIPSLHIHACWHVCWCFCWRPVMWLSRLRSKTPDPNGPKGMSHGESRALKMMFPEVVPWFYRASHKQNPLRQQPQN